MDFTATGYFKVVKQPSDGLVGTTLKLDFTGMRGDGRTLSFSNMNCKITSEDCVDAKCRCNLVKWESTDIIFKI